MKYVMALDGDRTEAAVLKKTLSDVIAGLSDEYWDTRFFSVLEEGRNYLREEPLIDFACCDVTIKGVTQLLPELRRSYEEMGMMLIADEMTSPMEYLKPGIRADSLLIRPYDTRTLNDTLHDFISEGLSRKNSDNGQGSFTMETKEGKTFFPYENIYYFEAREKKVFIRLLNEEYGFYSTMDELEGILPEKFRRCHRSYIVNVEKINRIFLSQNLIELVKDFTVPLSRSYRQSFKGL